MWIVAGYISLQNQLLHNNVLNEIAPMYPFDNICYVNHQNFKAVIISSELHCDANNFIYEDEQQLFFMVGTIYNKNQIAAEAKLNINDVTNDQQFFIQAYLKIGERLFERCYGKWFFICYSKQMFEITLYRDHLGMLPIYYYSKNDLFYFSTSLSTLLRFKDLPRQLNKRQLGALLLAYPGKPDETSYEHIKKVPSASKVILKTGSTKTILYWQPNSTTKHYSKNEEAYEEFNHLLHLVLDEIITNDTIVATTLSSGLDSSFLTAFTAQKMASQNRPLFAVTAVPLNEYKELESARRYGNELFLSQLLVARFSNLVHVIDNAQNVSLLGALHQSLKIHGYPVRNALNQHWLLSMLQQLQLIEVKKLLIAQMGNLTISWPFVELRQSLIRKFLQIAAMKMNIDNRQFVLRHKNLYNKQFLKQYQLPLFFKQAQYHPSFQSFSFDEKRNYFLKQYLWQGYSTWNEKGIHYNIDIVDPFADPRIINFCFSLPTHFFVKHKESRLFVKRLGKELVPTEIINNPKRAIQSADIELRIQKEYNQIKNLLKYSLKNDLLNEIFDVQYIYEQFVSNKLKKQVFLRFLLITLFIKNETTL